MPMNRDMHPSNAYLRLAEGPEDLLGSQLSATRRLLTLFVAVILFSGSTLFATAVLDLDHGLIGKALATTGKASSDGGDDDGNSGPGGGDDDDDDTDTGTHQQLDTDSGTDQNGDGDTDSNERAEIRHHRALHAKHVKHVHGGHHGPHAVRHHR